MNKKLYLVLVLTFLVNAITLAQLVNINPDPNGEPWIVNDATVPHQEVLSKAIPIISNPVEFSQLDTPSEYYNHLWQYFPPILNQFPSAACVSYAEIGYTLTYELNRYRNDEAGDWDDELNRDNLYYPLYTYNFLNNGDFTQGTHQGNALAVIKDNGCPMFSEYFDPILDELLLKYLYWMNGYDKYRNGMNNRINSMSYIEFTDNYLSLEGIKHWVHHHFEGSTYGGLALISVNAITGVIR